MKLNNLTTSFGKKDEKDKKETVYATRLNPGSPHFGKNNYDESTDDDQGGEKKKSADSKKVTSPEQQDDANWTTTNPEDVNPPE